MRCGNPKLLVPLIALVASIAALAQTPTYRLGRAPSEEEIRAWDISISTTGEELPPGNGTAKEGAALYAKKCVACHGASGEGTKFAPRLLEGKGGNHAARTAGNYWPFATTIWDYINRAMPLTQEASLKPDEVYALTAFLLFRSGIIQEADVIDAKSLPKVQMPNRNGFIPARPEDIRLPRCRLGTCP